MITAICYATNGVWDLATIQIINIEDFYIPLTSIKEYSEGIKAAIEDLSPKQEHWNEIKLIPVNTDGGNVYFLAKLT